VRLRVEQAAGEAESRASGGLPCSSRACRLYARLTGEGTLECRARVLLVGLFRVYARLTGEGTLEGALLSVGLFSVAVHSVRLRLVGLFFCRRALLPAAPYRLELVRHLGLLHILLVPQQLF